MKLKSTDMFYVPLHGQVTNQCITTTKVTRDNEKTRSCKRVLSNIFSISLKQYITFQIQLFLWVNFEIEKPKVRYQR